MADESGVLVLGDSTGGELSSTSRELLTAGRKAADDLGEELAIGLLGDTLDQPPQQLAEVRRVGKEWRSWWSSFH